MLSRLLERIGVVSESGIHSVNFVLIKEVIFLAVCK